MGIARATPQAGWRRIGWIPPRVRPGDCVVMRNDRTLHGRSAFDPNLGRRHLQGCYIDRDGVESRRLVLRRKLSA